MSKFESSDRATLLELLGQQLELFEQMFELCRKQTGLISEDKLDTLEVSLGEIQRLREKINGLHQKSEPLMQSYALASVKHKDDDIEELTAKMQEKIELCANLNAQNMDKMKTMIANHSKKIEAQSSKRKGIGGYAQAIPSKPEMFDRKS